MAEAKVEAKVEVEGGAKPRPALGIAGAGRVGGALARLLVSRSWQVAGVWSRSAVSAQRLAGQVGAAAWDHPAQLAAADLVLLTVPDDAIAASAAQIARAGGWRAGQAVVHCSGAVDVDALAPARAAGAWIGGFHPLQAFASVEAALEILPGSFFALEGEGPLRRWLPDMAAALEGSWEWLLPGTRPAYHAAAVFGSNYVVTLFAVASGLLGKAGISSPTAMRALLPLTRGTVSNLDHIGLPGALTGPIRRGDVETVRRHLDALRAQAPELVLLYEQLARQTIPIAAQLDAGAARRIQTMLETDTTTRHGSDS